MSQPAFVPDRREIWYTDGTSGFYALRLTNGAWPAAPTAGGSGTTGKPVVPVRCASRRRFVIHLHQLRGDHLRSARVYVDGKRVRVLHGGKHLRAIVDLRGKGRKVVTVRIVGRTRSGRVLRQTRRFHTCRARH